MTELEAREEVERKAQTGIEPALDESDLEAALASARRYSTWEAEAEVEYGARVVPTVKNGRRYRAIQGGTTGESEPSWGTVAYSRVTDGTVVWEEDGASGEEWDVRAAVHECWQIKAAKASTRIGFSSAGQSFQAQQLFEHCERMARRYAPAGVA